MQNRFVDFGFCYNNKKDDKIDQFLKKAEDPNWWRTIRDELNQKDIVLTDEQLKLIERIRKGKFASKAIADNDVNQDCQLFQLLAEDLNDFSFCIL